jgi:D-alanyl-D-alanine carboxypeptidase
VRRGFRPLILLVAILTLAPAAAAKKQHVPKLDFGEKEININLSDSPSSGLMFDLDDGTVLWSDNARSTRPIASLTKLMTALIVVDELDPKDKVKISSEAAGQPPVEIGLKAGTTMRTDDLMTAMLIPSANDAAVALADEIDHSARRFASTMNDRARKLDLGCTRYRTPSGLSDNDESCAEDLAKITMLALDEPRIADVVKKRSDKLKVPGKGKVRVVSTNPLHRDNYHGTIGVKTGFTDAAGHCLIAAVKQHGTTLVAILLDSPDTGPQAKKLLEKGFDEVKDRK